MLAVERRAAGFVDGVPQVVAFKQGFEARGRHRAFGEAAALHDLQKLLSYGLDRIERIAGVDMAKAAVFMQVDRRVEVLDPGAIVGVWSRMSCFEEVVKPVEELAWLLAG
jgi:hypothetical protein